MKRPSEDVILAMEDVKVHFDMDEGLLKAVDGVDFVIKKGRTLGIVGESGCGKSVTTNAIFKLLPKYGLISGNIWLYEKDGKELEEPINIAELNPTGDVIRSIRGGNISMIFQEPMKAFSPVHTIGNQIMETIMLHVEPDKKKAREICIEALRAVGISNPEQRVDEYPHQLSGGMRQRAMIAMALASNPRLLVADEPTTSLDVTVQAQILDLMKDLQQEMGMSILMINHNFGIIAETCDNVAVMYLGRIVETAATKELLENPMHPYTQDLFRSIPQVTDQRGRKLAYIEGSVPDAYSIPKGCAFFPRCRKAQKGLCDESIPPVVDLGNGHKVSCFRYDQ